MGHARIHGHVEAPIEQVFDYAVDFDHTAEWNVSVVEMKPGAPLAKVGDRFAGTMKFLGRVYEGEGEVIAIERPMMFAFVSSSPMGGHQNWTSHLTPAGNGTDIDSEIDYEVPLGFVGAFADKLFVERQVQKMLDQSRDNFIALVEQRALQPV
jgi:uncharacterized protein YndB with AHSA1/START domain